MAFSLRAWLAPRREIKWLRENIAVLRGSLRKDHELKEAWAARLEELVSEAEEIRQSLAHEREMHAREVAALHEDLAGLRGCNDEMKKLGLFFRENYAEQIRVGAHDGLSISECVIAYLRGQAPKARQQKVTEETQNV